MSDEKTPAPVHPLLEGTTPGPLEVVNTPERITPFAVVGENIKGVRIATARCYQKPDALLYAAASTLAAENARLRAALEALVRHSTESHMCYPDCVDNAREVLASLTT